MQEIGGELGEQSQENQFDLVSAIKSNQEVLQYMEGANQKMEVQQFNNKLNYYYKLSQQNKQMLNQLRQIDVQLNSELKQITTKRLLVADKTRAGLNSERSKSVMIKYKELDSVKKQLSIKLQQKTPLQDLQLQITNLKALQKQKHVEIEAKLKMLKKLQGISESKEHQDSLLSGNNSVLLAESYMTVVKQLKEKIKLKTTKIYEQKQRFIDESKKRKRTNQSTSTTKINADDLEKLSPHVQELKVKYEAIGFRIEVLKNQKKNFLEQTKNYQERRKYLEKLKTKLFQLTKI